MSNNLREIHMQAVFLFINNRTIFKMLYSLWIIVKKLIVKNLKVELHSIKLSSYNTF